MRTTRLFVLLGAVQIMACSSSSSTSGTDLGVEGPGEVQGTDTNPYGVAYPTKNIGYQPRRGALAGNVMPNYKFLGFPNGDTSKGLQPVSLADYFDPEVRQYKILHISAAGSWCYWCQQEAIQVVKDLETLKGMKVAYLTALSEGPTQGKPATTQDLLNWIKSYDINYTHVLDPGNQNLAPFFEAASMPWNADLDARTMEILDAHVGVNSTLSGDVDIVGDAQKWVKWVDTHPVH